jgi:thymidylate kinase
MFIIEGPDCAGKSTLCSLLSLVLKLDVIHLDSKSDNSYEAYKKRINDMIKTPVIYDRFFFSEAVYSQILHRERAFSDSEYTLLQRKLLNSNVQTIHCTSSDHTLLKRAEERGETFVTPQQLLSISTAFWRHFEDFPHTVIELDINNKHSSIHKFKEHVASLYGTKNENE